LNSKEWLIGMLSPPARRIVTAKEVPKPLSVTCSSRDD
jgi:hypothetical protein